MIRNLILIAVSMFAGMAAGVEVGDQSPCVRLPHLDGSGGCINQSSRDFTLLEFSSVFCGACRVNVPTIESLGREIQGNTFTRFVYSNPENISRSFAAQYNISLAFAMDISTEAFKAYGILDLPVLMVIDASGKVIYKHKGVLNEAAVSQIRAVTGN